MVRAALAAIVYVPPKLDKPELIKRLTDKTICIKERRRLFNASYTRFTYIELKVLNRVLK